MKINFFFVFFYCFVFVYLVSVSKSFVNISEQSPNIESILSVSLFCVEFLFCMKSLCACCTVSKNEFNFSPALTIEFLDLKLVI